MTYEEFLAALDDANICTSKVSILKFYGKRHEEEVFSEKALLVTWCRERYSGASCWDNKRATLQTPDQEPEFENFDKAIEILCPDIKLLQYKKVCKLINVIENYSGYTDYYGNSSETSAKYVDLKELYDFLQENVNGG